MSNYVPLTAFQNEPKDFLISVTDAAGSAVPLDSYAAAAWIKANPDDAEPVAEATVTIPYGGAGSNQLRVYFSKASVAALETSQHWYDVLITPSGGDPDNIQHGPMNVRHGITQ